MKTLVSFSRPEVLPLLRELAKDENPAVRAEAMRTLASFPVPEVLPLLQELIKDENPALRAETMRTLANFPAPEILPLLRELIKDESLPVRAEAVGTLAGFSRPEVPPLLRELALAPDGDQPGCSRTRLSLLPRESRSVSDPKRPDKRPPGRRFSRFGRPALYAVVAEAKRQVAAGSCRRRAQDR